MSASPVVIKLLPSVSWKEVDGRVVALNLTTSTYLTANLTGTLLWPLLVDGTTSAALVARLVDEYGISDEVAAADVDAFVGALRSAELLADPA